MMGSRATARFIKSVPRETGARGGSSFTPPATISRVQSHCARCFAHGAPQTPSGEIDAAAESAHLPRDVSEGQLGRFGSHQLALDRGVESRAHPQRRAPTGSAGDRRGDLVVVSVEPSRELGPRAVGVVVRREAPSVSRPEGFHVRVVEVIDDGPRRLARRLDPEEVRGVVDESDDVKSHLSGEVGEHGARRTRREERGRREASDARPTRRRETRDSRAPDAA